MLDFPLEAVGQMVDGDSRQVVEVVAAAVPHGHGGYWPQAAV